MQQNGQAPTPYQQPLDTPPSSITISLPPTKLARLTIRSLPSIDAPRRPLQLLCQTPYIYQISRPTNYTYASIYPIGGVLNSNEFDSPDFYKSDEDKSNIYVHEEELLKSSIKTKQEVVPTAITILSASRFVNGRGSSDAKSPSRKHTFTHHSVL